MVDVYDVAVSICSIHCSPADGDAGRVSALDCQVSRNKIRS